MNSVVLIILLIVAVLVLVWWFKHAKKLKISNVYFISGAVKTGKSFVSVALAVKTYKRNLLKYYLSIPILYIVHKFKKDTRHKKFSVSEYKPMLYSNIPLRFIKHNRFTDDILLRRVRIPNKSVVLLDETSLIADSMLYKNDEINANLMLFFKLFGHYSHGGTCICNSQTISDNHFSLKRSMGRYLYVYNRVKFPFFTRVKGVEQVYSDDNSTSNVLVGDIEDSQKSMLFLNRYYKYYDCYCYSIFTDDLCYQVDYSPKILRRADSLKCDHLVTLQNFGEYLDKRKKVDNEKVA